MGLGEGVVKGDDESLTAEVGVSDENAEREVCALGLALFVAEGEIESKALELEVLLKPADDVRVSSAVPENKLDDVTVLVTTSIEIVPKFDEEGVTDVESSVEDEGDPVCDRDLTAEGDVDKEGLIVKTLFVTLGERDAEVLACDDADTLTDPTSLLVEPNERSALNEIEVVVVTEGDGETIEVLDDEEDIEGIDVGESEVDGFDDGLFVSAGEREDDGDIEIRAD